MKRKVRRLTAAMFLAIVSWICVFPQGNFQITVDAGKPGAQIEATMWGVFFEDINFAADGGIYAELVKNRSFEFSMPMMGWRTAGKQNGTGRIVPNFYSPHNNSNPRFMRIHIDPAAGSFRIINEGFRGMGIKQGEDYHFSLLARSVDGTDLKVTVELITPEGESISTATIGDFRKEWSKHSASLNASATAEKAQLRLTVKGEGAFDLDMVSLFPADTWKGRPNGLRKDIVEMIAGLKPGFVRFPGGCIVEGRDLTNRYQWKTTVGPVEERKLIINRWNMEIQSRQAPDYFQSFGVGFYEYFLLAEDLGAEPLPILNCGMSCQFNAGEVVPLDELDPYITDALDLIEFANGETTTRWGALRAEMGHPGKFNLKFLGIGNEQWEEQYIERYREFEKVLKEKHPEIKLISGSGPYASGRYFDIAWTELRKLKPDLVDEHYYMPPEWFFANAGRYDNYDRSGPRIFAGEYAAHGKENTAPESRNSWISALAEAAFMTGLERNADLVTMASYAPLLAHVEAWQWRPDLIWFDNLHTVGTPNYYVQKLFSTHRGTHVVPVLSGTMPINGRDSLYASSTVDMIEGKLYIKVINTARAKKPVRISVRGVSFEKVVERESLASEDAYAYNTITGSKPVLPQLSQVKSDGRSVEDTLGPMSANIYILNLNRRR